MALSRSVTVVNTYGSASKSVSYNLTGETELEISETVTAGASVVIPFVVSYAHVQAIYIDSSTTDVSVQTNVPETLLASGSPTMVWASGMAGSSPLTVDATSITIDNTAGSADATVRVFAIYDTP